MFIFTENVCKYINCCCLPPKTIQTSWQRRWVWNYCMNHMITWHWDQELSLSMALVGTTKTCQRCRVLGEESTAVSRNGQMVTAHGDLTTRRPTNGHGSILAGDGCCMSYSLSLFPLSPLTVKHMTKNGYLVEPEHWKSDSHSITLVWFPAGY